MHNKAKKGFVPKLVILAIVLAMLLVIGIVVSNSVNRGSSQTKEEFTVDASKFAETKEEDFDIMEYDDYLALNRTIMFSEKDTGVSYSIDDTNYWGFGEDIKLVYELIEALVAGDSETYNSLVHKDVGHFDSFTQQQIYDVFVTREEKSNVNSGNTSYTEYVVKVEYKIHENNGSFRRDIESDASRPQYFVIDNSNGSLLVTEIVSVKYAN